MSVSTNLHPNRVAIDVVTLWLLMTCNEFKEIYQPLILVVKATGEQTGVQISKGYKKPLVDPLGTVNWLGCVFPGDCWPHTHLKKRDRNLQKGLSNHQMINAYSGCHLKSLAKSRIF